jgi:hypothetical protein
MLLGDRTRLRNGVVCNFYKGENLEGWGIGGSYGSVAKYGRQYARKSLAFRDVRRLRKDTK